MKKAKIMLSTIILFAVVGGALAFKAKNNNFGHTITLFACTSSNTIAAYTAIGQSGCFDPFVLGNATTVNGRILIGGSITTFLTDDCDEVCTTSVTVQAGE